MKREKREKRIDGADLVLIVLVIVLVVGGFVWLKHKDEQAREYAERNACEWVAVGGFDVCK